MWGWEALVGSRSDWWCGPAWLLSYVFFSGRLFMFLPRNWIDFFIDCCVVVSFCSSGWLQLWLHFPKVPLSALVCNYRQILIAIVLSIFFERLISSRFGRFLVRSRVLPFHQYSYRENLGTCDALLDVVSAGKIELDMGGGLSLVQIYFSAAFDWINHRGLVFKSQEARVEVVPKIFAQLYRVHMIVCVDR